MKLVKHLDAAAEDKNKVVKNFDHLGKLELKPKHTIKRKRGENSER
jgi:hypothetical protein